jgi:hypothetical protein
MNASELLRHWRDQLLIDRAQVESKNLGLLAQYVLVNRYGSRRTANQIFSFK